MKNKSDLAVDSFLVMLIDQGLSVDIFEHKNPYIFRYVPLGIELYPTKYVARYTRDNKKVNIVEAIRAIKASLEQPQEKKQMKKDYAFNIKVSLEDIIQEIDTGDLFDTICRDIHEDNPEWWAEKVCKPIKDCLLKELRDQTSEILRDIIHEVVDEYLLDHDLLTYSRVEDMLKEYLVEEYFSKLNLDNISLGFKK